ncbi:hypothetical protein ACXYMO_04705 [Arenibacterium sp. CAU 1754]
MKIKRGDTFTFSGNVSATVNGVPQSDFTGWTATSQLRQKNGNLVADLSVTWLDASAGLVKVEHAGSTDNWPLGDIDMDIQFTAPGGEIVSTDTVTFEVVSDVTRAA